VKQVGRELGVRYVLEGGVRKSGNRIRATAQLVEAETGNHIWAERYDRDLVDIFALQDEITDAVTIAVAPAIRNAELRRAIQKPAGNLDAWAAYQRGLWHTSKVTPDDNILAQRFFQRAIDIDPTFAGGYKGLAVAYGQAATDLQVRAPTEAHSSAEVLARRAIALDPVDAEAYSTLAKVILYSRSDYEGALAEAGHALALSPNLPTAHVVLAQTLIFSGQPREGLAALERSIKLDPHNRTPGRLNLFTVGLYFSLQYEASAEAAKRVVRSNPKYPLPHRWLAAALGQLGRTAEAKEALERALEIAPASFDMYVRQRVPWMRPEDHAHMLEGLRKAGWEG
jgi:adenylate cyclase